MLYIKQHRNLREILSGLILIVLFMGSGCGNTGDPGLEGSSTTRSEQLTSVTITFSDRDVPESVGAESIRRSAEMPPGIKSLNVEVTAADISTPIQKCAAVTGGTLPAITLEVPSGENRTFTVGAFESAADCTGTPRYKGQNIVSLAAGVATTVNITLRLFESGSPSVTTTFPPVDAMGMATNTSITATFNRDMDPTSLTTSTFTIKKASDGTTVAGSVFYNAYTRTALFTPSALMSLNTSYTATIKTGAKDRAGNGLAVDFPWSFTTANTAAGFGFSPVVVATSPRNGALSVPLTATVSATFNTGMDASTITTDTYTLKSTGGTVSGTVTYDAATKTATFTPAASLTAGTTYSATLTGGIRDSTGIALEPTAWSFTTPPAAASSPIGSIAAGSSHSLASRADGLVVAWGNNSSGQLGDGTVVSRSTPTFVVVPLETGFFTSVSTVAAGDSYSLALKSDGTVWAWGYNSYGQLGNGTTINRSTPVQVKGAGGTGLLTDVIAIDAGASHSLALQQGGTVWAWGNNSSGQLGDGTTTNSSTPVQVTGINNVKDMAAGENHTLVLRNDGTVWAWGYNGYGQLGDGSTISRETPVKVANLTGVDAIAAGASYSLALKSDGTVWAWGANYSGQLGDGTTYYYYATTTPVQVKGVEGVGFLTNVIAIAASSHSLALKQGGTVWAWGNNNYAQLGDGTTTNRTTPIQVTGLN